MVGVYDLYDLYAVFIRIRHCPDSPANLPIINSIISALKDKENCELNQIRRAIRSAEGYQKNEAFAFAETDNVYSYMPLPFLKDDYVYEVLIAACAEMSDVLKKGNQERAYDLADCLHNLPIMIVENNYAIPKRFWKNEVKRYREKHNRVFLYSEAFRGIRLSSSGKRK